MNTINDINKKVCNDKNRLNSLSIILIFFCCVIFWRNCILDTCRKVLQAIFVITISPWRRYKGASTRSYTKLFYLVLLYVYDLLSLVHVRKYVCVYEYDVLQPCWIFVRRTRVRRTNVRACCIQMSLLSSLAFQIKWCFYKI